jgi:uncharacterized protein Veg
MSKLFTLGQLKTQDVKGLFYSHAEKVPGHQGDQVTLYTDQGRKKIFSSFLVVGIFSETGCVHV